MTDTLLVGIDGSEDGRRAADFAASCAKAGQKVPNGYYNLEHMLRSMARRGGKIGVCGTCMDARGITEIELVEGCHRSTMDELTDWTARADRVLVF